MHLKLVSKHINVYMQHLAAHYTASGNASYVCIANLIMFYYRANPMCLGSLSEFQSGYEKPILEGQKYNCTKRQLALSRQSK